jgi:hypothetical protein
MRKKIWNFLCFCVSIGLAAGVQAQDPDIQAEEDARLEEIFRTADLPGQTPVNRRDRAEKKRVSAPKDGIRVGCQCMDDTRQDAHSSGACSGHGGVRYWLYRAPSGDTVKVLTERHERHPHPLTEQERSEMNPQKAPRNKGPVFPTASLMPAPVAPVVVMPAPGAGGGGFFDWSDVAGITAIGVSAYVTVRFVLGWVKKNERLVRYALRHLLRPRKRSIAGKNRKDAAPPRV